MSSTYKPWHIIRCSSGQEGRAERYLERMGYPNGWHPTEKVRLSEAIYQRMVQAAKKLPAWAQSRKPSRYKVKTTVTGYVFLPADHVIVHQINGHHPNVWMEVLCVNGEPYRMSDDQMAQMRETPDRVRDIVNAAEAAKLAAWEAMRPAVGAMGRIVRGSFEGNQGPVVSIGAGEVKIDIGAVAGHVTLPEQMVERV